MKEHDLGKRAGLYDTSKSKKGKDKRREFRSGMGNEESSYGDEDYDSEDGEYYKEDDIEVKEKVVVKPAPVKRRPPTPEPSSSSSSSVVEESSIEESSVVESSLSEIIPKPVTPLKKAKPPPVKEKTPPPVKEKTPPPKKEKKEPSEAEKTLEQLAKEMKEDHKRLEIERLRIIEKETLLLKETGSWKDETNAIRKELKDIKKDREMLSDEVDQKISDKLANIDGNKRKTPAGHWIVELPFPVRESMDYHRELDGDEEYWLQNLSGIHGDASARS